MLLVPNEAGAHGSAEAALQLNITTCSQNYSGEDRIIYGADVIAGDEDSAVSSEMSASDRVGDNHDHSRNDTYGTCHSSFSDESVSVCVCVCVHESLIDNLHRNPLS